MSDASKMKKLRNRTRHGLSLIEIVVAATLLVSLVGFVTPLTVRLGRVWQGTRDHRLALNELANQMEVLTSLGVSRCEIALANLEPSASIVKSLRDARLEGELARDQDGIRLLLSIDWNRGTDAVPLRLVGWIDAGPVDDPQPKLDSSERNEQRP